MITLRPARSTDVSFFYDCLCDLEAVQLDLAAFSRIFFQNITDPTIRYVIADSDNVPVGFLNCHVQWLLHHAGPVGEIQEMYVLAEWRSKGVGQLLIEHMAEQGRHENWVNLEVTSNRRRQRTHAFYERMGFINSHVKLVNSLMEPGR
ncbi:GNAT family N-acetyltransferase [Fibrella arboris]|uniref:GNAT family N-acetyltransferase n=1 Tax=Fibrella arboris TaxID=3242486 RepID=UPI003522FCDE